MTRRDDLTEQASMPFGEPIYTYAPDPKPMMGGSAQPLYGPVKKHKRARRIGFQPPHERKD